MPASSSRTSKISGVSRRPLRFPENSTTTPSFAPTYFAIIGLKEYLETGCCQRGERSETRVTNPKPEVCESSMRNVIFVVGARSVPSSSTIWTCASSGLPPPQRLARLGAMCADVQHGVQGCIESELATLNELQRAVDCLRDVRR